MSKIRVVFFGLLSALAFTVHAADGLPGLSFSHHDWELACDNTHTCRAAGYHADDDTNTISLLLTRKAGPREPVTGQLMIGQSENDEFLNKAPATLTLILQLNGKKLGSVSMQKENLIAELSAEQVSALLAALPHKSTVEWSTGNQRWRLSDRGAAAVLLKMDEFQGRLGTPGALVRKGARSEDSVTPPRQAPVVNAVALAKPQPGDAQFAVNHGAALRKALHTTLKDDEVCPDFSADKTHRLDLSVTRLTPTQFLVSTQCWLAAYNAGNGYWVVDTQGGFRAQRVTTSGTEDHNGKIIAGHKGRGLGDCWSIEEWTWDGKQFVYTRATTTGMCKGLRPGGGWDLPRLVTEVRAMPSK